MPSLLRLLGEGNPEARGVATYLPALYPPPRTFPPVSAGVRSGDCCKAAVRKSVALGARAPGRGGGGVVARSVGTPKPRAELLLRDAARAEEEPLRARGAELERSAAAALARSAASRSACSRRLCSSMRASSRCWRARALDVAAAAEDADVKRVAEGGRRATTAAGAPPASRSRALRSSSSSLAMVVMSIVVREGAVDAATDDAPPALPSLRAPGDAEAPPCCRSSLRLCCFRFCLAAR